MKIKIDRDASSGSYITYENLNSLLAPGDTSQACLKLTKRYKIHLFTCIFFFLSSLVTWWFSCWALLTRPEFDSLAKRLSWLSFRSTYEVGERKPNAREETCLETASLTVEAAARGKGAFNLPSTAVNHSPYFFCGSFYQRYLSTLPANKRTKPTWKKEVQSCEELVRYSECAGALRDFGRCGLTTSGFLRWMKTLSSLGPSMTMMNGKLHSRIGWVAVVTHWRVSTKQDPPWRTLHVKSLGCRWLHEYRRNNKMIKIVGVFWLVQILFLTQRKRLLAWGLQAFLSRACCTTERFEETIWWQSCCTIAKYTSVEA